jgi:hypothetical protein
MNLLLAVEDLDISRVHAAGRDHPRYLLGPVRVMGIAWHEPDAAQVRAACQRLPANISVSYCQRDGRAPNAYTLEIRAELAPDERRDLEDLLARIEARVRAALTEPPTP